jgi:hypothetical protein
MAVNSETTVRKLVSLSRAQLQSIQNFRFEQRIGAESEAIRRLLDLGLEAARKGIAPITPTEADEVR